MTTKSFVDNEVKQKPEGGDLINLWLTRRFSIRLSRVLFDLPVTPNMVTFCAFITLIVSGLLFSVGSWLFALSGMLLLPLYQVLDCSDGELARMRGCGTKYGKWLDNALDNVGWGIFLLCIGIGTGNIWLASVALFGYYVSTVTFYYGTLTFGARTSHTDINKLHPTQIIYRSIRGFSINVQMAFFMFGALFDVVSVALLLYTLYVNAYWPMRFISYRRLE